MAEEITGEVTQISDAEPPKIIKKKRVRRKKQADLLDPYAYIAAEFGKELAEPVSKLPSDCQWYAWTGPVDTVAMFFDTRKFERFQYVSELTVRPDGATGACVFF